MSRDGYTGISFELNSDLAPLAAQQQSSQLPSALPTPSSAFVASINNQTGNVDIVAGTSSPGVTVNVAGGSGEVSVGVLIPSTNAPLASVSLDLNTNTKQALYEVPVGKSAIITQLVLRSPSGDITGGLTTRLEFGFNAGSDDWTSGSHFDVAASGLTASTLFAVYNQQSAAANTASTIGTAAQVFGAITDVAFGSAATVIIDVIGYIF